MKNIDLETFTDLARAQLRILDDTTYDYLALYSQLGTYARKQIFAGKWCMEFIHRFYLHHKADDPKVVVILFPNSWDGVVLYRATSFLVKQNEYR